MTNTVLGSFTVVRLIWPLVVVVALKTVSTWLLITYTREHITPVMEAIAGNTTLVSLINALVFYCTWFNFTQAVATYTTTIRTIRTLAVALDSATQPTRVAEILRLAAQETLRAYPEHFPVVEPPSPEADARDRDPADSWVEEEDESVDGNTDTGSTDGDTTWLDRTQAPHQHNPAARSAFFRKTTHNRRGSRPGKRSPGHRVQLFLPGAPMQPEDLLNGAPLESTEGTLVLHLALLLGFRPHQHQSTRETLLYVYLTNVALQLEHSGLHTGLQLGNPFSTGATSGNPGGATATTSTDVKMLSATLRTIYFNISDAALDTITTNLLTLYFSVMPVYTTLLYSWYAIGPMVAAGACLLGCFTLAKTLRDPFQLICPVEAQRHLRLGTFASRHSELPQLNISRVSLEWRTLRVLFGWLASIVVPCRSLFNWSLF
jgi:hypothetical protein